MRLVRLSDFSGDACSIYSVLEDDGKPSFQKFLEELGGTYDSELININGRITSIGKLGASEGFFKMEEWKHDSKICCLYDDPDTLLRIFCIRFINEKILVLGGGGVKPKDTRAWQETPKLKREAEQIILISSIIKTKIDKGTIKISDDGLKILGDLKIP